MGSGRAAAEVILGDPGRRGRALSGQTGRRPPPIFSDHRRRASHAAGTAPAVAAVARLLTTAGRGNALSGGWAVFWNELLDGAPRNRHRSIANAVTQIGRVMTTRTSTTSSFNATFRDGAPHPSDISRVVSTLASRCGMWSK